MSERTSEPANNAGKAALITGAGQRIGARIAKTLHENGFNVVLHCRRSRDAAGELAAALNRERDDSAHVLSANLLNLDELEGLADAAHARWRRLDVLVNNASVFRATALGELDEAVFDELIGVNLKAPLFLAQRLAPELQRRGGCIVNLTDIHAGRPLKDHPAYCAAKAGLAMLTRSLARELAPKARCNAVAPGAILWPRDDDDDQRRREIVRRTALGHTGSPADVAKAVAFLVAAGYVTGQTITVDGGRTLRN